MSDKKDNGEQQRHWRVEDDAYDDLLKEYFPTKDEKPVKKNTVEPIEQHKTVQRKKAPEKKTVQQPKKSDGFKLEIKDLDNEFNVSGPKKQSAQKGISRADLYKKATPPKEKKVTSTQTTRPNPKPHSEEPKPVRTDNKLDDTIDFLPAFTYNGTSEIKPEVKPVYYQPKKTEQNSAPQTQRAKKPEPTKKPTLKQLVTSKFNEISSHEADKPYKSVSQGDSAVIIKKNELPPKKRIVQFFMQNRKAWLLVAICVVCAILISTYAISCTNDILAINRDSEEVVTINLPADTNTKSAISILKDNGLIKHKIFCTVFAKAMAYKDNNYLTGIYYLTGSMGLENMLSAFKAAPVTGETVTLTFPEGYSVDQIAEKLAKYEVCTTTAFYTTMHDVDFSSEYSFIAEANDKEKRYRILEGYMYPDTYDFYKGENASSVIRKFLDNFKSKWTDEYAAQAQKLGMSVDDVITLASILEKEAYGADQMSPVSSVLHNRLNKPGLFPTLQCDSTTAYINDYIAKNVTDSVALGRYTQEYSTNRCEGLPVGAICNPGNDAIHGALYPSDTNYYFFLHDNNKKLYLAATDEEHRANGMAALKANSAAAAN